MYKLFKENFQLEYYLTAVATVKYRIALKKIRVSCHRLAIKSGQYHKPASLPVDQPYNNKLKTKYISYAHANATLI